MALGGLTSLFSQSTVQAVGAGLLTGAIGGTALVATGVIPLGAETVTPATIQLLACPDAGPALAQISDGQRLLVTGKSADGTWLEVYIGQPGVDRAWAEATSLSLESGVDTLPVVACDAPPGPSPATLPPPAATASPTVTIEPTLIPSASPSPSPTATAKATATATVRATATPKPTKKPNATKTPGPVATKTPTPAPPKATPTPTPQPTVNPPPSLSDLSVSQQNFCQTGSSTVSVTATDPQGIDVVRITYRPNGGPTYGPVAMQPQGGDVWTYSITPQGWNEGFVSITVTAYDNFGANSSLSNVDDFNNPSSLYVTSFC
jgi:hypothetical protein